ncbi:thimet oligopeptidase [Trypanosoma cruzi]|nr:thimet oligopeptidase [Trypanosoma cruzi]
MRPHTVDGRAHSAAGWAGEPQSAARWSARIWGAHVGKRFRLRQRRAGLLSKKGRRHRHRGFLVIRRARAGMSKSGQESHRACAQSRHSGHDVRVVPGIESSPHRQAPAMRCTRLLFFWASLQYGHPTGVKKSTCQIGPPSCGRDRAIMASSSSASLRGIPQCDGENMKSTE